MPIALLSKRPVMAVEVSDPGLQRRKVRAVVNYIVGYGQAFLSACLSSQYLLRLFASLGVARQQAPDLCLLVAIDDQHAIDEIPQCRSNQ